MSSLAYAPARARRGTASRALADAFSEHGSDVLLAVAMAAIATVLIGFLPKAFNVDSWLALVTGRQVAQHGIPANETLTALAHGRTWIDQQWLSQLTSYGLYRVGGLALLGLVNVGLIMLGVGGAVLGARRLGAPARAVMLALPLCAWLMFPSGEVRTQEFAVPLFVAVAYLLARDGRSPSNRVYWCLPLLVLWANLHGTVTLGVMLVAIRGVTLVWERRSRLTRSLTAWLRPFALIVGAPLTLLATPYGLQAVPYYKAMLLSSSLRHTVTEWQPIIAFPILAGGFFVAAAILLWSFRRNPARTTPWDRLSLIAMMLGAFSVNRNTLFFGLEALILLPVSLNLRPGSRPASPRAARVNLIASATALLALLLAIATTFVRPASSIEFSYQRLGLLHAVQSATRSDPSLKVFADVRFADWLLWRDLSLNGRIANDARFELLSGEEMNRLQQAFEANGRNWKQAAEGYGLIVADRTQEPGMVAGFMHEQGARVLYNDGQRIVILRSGREAL